MFGKNLSKHLVSRISITIFVCVSAPAFGEVTFSWVTAILFGTVYARVAWIGVSFVTAKIRATLDLR